MLGYISLWGSLSPPCHMENLSHWSGFEERVQGWEKGDLAPAFHIVHTSRGVPVLSVTGTCLVHNNTVPVSPINRDFIQEMTGFGAMTTLLGVVVLLGDVVCKQTSRDMIPSCLSPPATICCAI